MFKLTEMNGAFGAIVDDIDLNEPLEETELRRLVDALYQHHILIIRDQHLESPAYVRFGRSWGEPILFFNPSHRDQEFPEIIRIHNSRSTPAAQQDAALHWHADGTYEPVPASMTMLYALEAPLVGNETLFADMAAAYDALPEAMRKRLDTLQVQHPVSGGKVFTEGEKRGSGRDQHSMALPPVIQPLVISHPVTGRKALYAISGSAAGIVGMPESEGVALLLSLKKHATQPQFVQRAKAAPGCLVMWDNFGVMHSATPTEYSDEDGKRRLLHRISTRGLPSICGIPFEWPTVAAVR